MRYLITLLICFSVTVNLWAQNYFQAGMKWTVEHIVTVIPEVRLYQEEIWLEESTDIQDWFPEKVDSSGILAMYSRNKDNTSEKNFLAWIKADNGKVWAIQPPRKDYIAKDWQLLYDFDLKVGEGCAITPIVTGNNNPEEYQSNLTCLNIKTEEDNLTIMDMEEYPYDSNFATHGRWIKGVGSEVGVLNACGFEREGASSILVEAKFRDEIIYSHPAPSGNLSISREIEIIREGSTIKVNPRGKDNSIKIFDVNGIKLLDISGSEDTIQFSLKQSGLYIIIIGNSIYKILK